LNENRLSDGKITSFTEVSEASLVCNGVNMVRYRLYINP